MSAKEAYTEAYRRVRIEERLAASCPRGDFRTSEIDTMYMKASRSYMANQRIFSGWITWQRQMEFHTKRWKGWSYAGAKTKS